MPNDPAPLLILSAATLLAAIFVLLLLRLKIGSTPGGARLLRHR
jgi:hypothetical protein